MHFIPIPSQPFLSSESFLKFLLQAFTFTQYPLHTTNISLQAFSSLHMPKTTLPLSKNSSIVLQAYSTFPICPKQLSPPHTSLHSSPSPSTLPIYPSPFTNLLLISRKLFPLPLLKALTNPPTQKEPRESFAMLPLSKQVLLFYLSAQKGAHQFRETLSKKLYIILQAMIFLSFLLAVPFPSYRSVLEQHLRDNHHLSVSMIHPHLQE